MLQAIRQIQNQTRNAILCVLFYVCLCLPALADNTPAPVNNADTYVQSALHILDYVSVDYPSVVVNGKVVNPEEYAEQKEFAQQLTTVATQLPNSSQKDQIIKDATSLSVAIKNRSAGTQITQLCAELTTTLIEVYHVSIAPRTAPILDGVDVLFQNNCAGCHGVHGYGNGPNAAGLEPAPANFHDANRQQHRSVYSLYNTITLGVTGTAMPAFNQLSSEQRWQLAFYASNFFADDAMRIKGAAVWEQSKQHLAVTDLRQLSKTTPAQIQQSHGDDGVALLAYLRSTPSVLQAGTASPWHTAREKLAASMNSYAMGDDKSAYDFAVAAYLEGYELVETKLDTVSPEMRKEIEHSMLSLRDMIKKKAEISVVHDKQSRIIGMLDEAEGLVNTTTMSATVNFFSAFLILLREGIEAILVLAAIAAVLLRTGRSDGLRYLHLGWISALLLGVLTWFIASHYIDISGANREFTEGITALVAAVMLIYVGFWLHKQTYAVQWQKYIHARINRSVTNGALFGLTSIAFIAVYREVFESILFFQTLNLQSGPSGSPYIISGTVSAAVLLVFLSWLIFKFSVRLPLKLFFRINAVLLYALAIVFSGKGIAALQEAGKLPVSTISFPEIKALGIFPNLQSLTIQLLLILIAVMLFLYSRNKMNRQMLSEGRQ